MFHLSKLRALGTIALLVLLVSQANDAWPDRPIKLIVPSAAGGSPDIVSRLVAYELSKRLGQPVVIDNRPGAGGNIGMQALMAAAPDGYTLAYGNNATLATNESLYSKLSYEPGKLLPVVALVSTNNLLVVNKGLPVSTVSELIAYARKHPDRLSMGSAGTGTTSHLGGELFKSMSGVSIQHVAYKGSPQAIQDLMGNSIQLMFDNVPSIGSSVSADKVRALAVTSKRRSPLFPQIPTMDEAGVRGYEMTAWGGLVATHGVPMEVIERLNKEVNTILEDERIKAQLAKIGFEALGGTAQQFQAFVASERTKWSAVIQKSGAKVD